MPTAPSGRRRSPEVPNRLLAARGHAAFVCSRNPDGDVRLRQVATCHACSRSSDRHPHQARAFGRVDGDRSPGRAGGGERAQILVSRDRMRRMQRLAVLLYFRASKQGQPHPRFRCALVARERRQAFAIPRHGAHRVVDDEFDLGELLGANTIGGPPLALLELMEKRQQQRGFRPRHGGKACGGVDRLDRGGHADVIRVLRVSGYAGTLPEVAARAKARCDCRSDLQWPHGSGSVPNNPIQITDLHRPVRSLLRLPSVRCEGQIMSRLGKRVAMLGAATALAATVSTAQAQTGGEGFGDFVWSDLNRTAFRTPASQALPTSP